MSWFSFLQIFYSTWFEFNFIFHVNILSFSLHSFKQYQNLPEFISHTQSLLLSNGTAMMYWGSAPVICYVFFS